MMTAGRSPVCFCFSSAAAAGTSPVEPTASSVPRGQSVSPDLTMVEAVERLEVVEDGKGGVNPGMLLSGVAVEH